MNFDIKTEQLSADAYVISLTGEVDLYTAPEFKQQLLEVIGQGGKEVVVDFSDTTFIDSTTLGVLVGGVKRLRTNDGQLSLVCSDRNITKIFEITGLDQVFTIYPTREEAVSALGVPKVEARRTGSRALGAGLAAAALLAAGCGTGGVASAGGPPDTQNGQTALHGEAAAVPHALGGRHERHDRPEPRQRLRRPTSSRASSRARSRTSSSTRSGSAPGRARDRTRRASTSSSMLPQAIARRAPMPANIVTGQDAIDVAAYVASVAGTAGYHGRRIREPGTDGKAIFKGAGCAGCHTLAAAGATGTIGPNLDQLKPSVGDRGAPGDGRRRRDAGVQGRR